MLGEGRAELDVVEEEEIGREVELVVGVGVGVGVGEGEEVGREDVVLLLMRLLLLLVSPHNPKLERQPVSQ